MSKEFSDLTLKSSVFNYRNFLSLPPLRCRRQPPIRPSLQLVELTRTAHLYRMCHRDTTHSRTPDRYILHKTMAMASRLASMRRPAPKTDDTTIVLASATAAVALWASCLRQIQLLAAACLKRTKMSPYS